MKLLLIFLFSLPMWAQSGNALIRTFPAAPTGSCSFIMLATDNSNGDFYNCFAGAWNAVGGGGSSFSWTSGAAGRICFYADATHCDGDSNLLWDGTTLSAGGSLSGTESLSEPTFASGAMGPWAVDNSFALAAGSATYTAGAGANAGDVYQNEADMSVPLVAGQVYQLSYTVSASSGTANLTCTVESQNIANAVSLIVSVGTHTAKFVYDGAGYFIIYCDSTNTASITFTSISAKRDTRTGMDINGVLTVTTIATPDNIVYNSATWASGCMAIGYATCTAGSFAAGTAVVSHGDAIGVGQNASASGDGCIAIGHSASCTNTAAVVIGAQSTTTGTASTVIGYGNNDNGFSAVMIGGEGSPSISATANGQVIFWGSDMYFYNPAMTSPIASAVHAAGGSGSNVAGANLIIAGGRGTGSGNGGSVKIQGASAGGSGSSQNALADIAVFDPANGVSVSSLTTTGSATGKKVVCVDTATGRLYASSTGTDCSN